MPLFFEPVTDHSGFWTNSTHDFLLFRHLFGPDCGENYCDHQSCWEAAGTNTLFMTCTWATNPPCCEHCEGRPHWRRHNSHALPCLHCQEQDEDECDRWMRLDRKFGTDENSPLHHNNRCSQH